MTAQISIKANEGREVFLGVSKISNIASEKTASDKDSVSYQVER